MTTTKIPVEFLNALSGSEITDGSIGTADIANDAITTAKIAANAITATELPDNVITATHIPNGLITGTHMAGDTVTATQIADNAVGTGQLAGIARGKIIYGDSNGDPQLLALGSNGQVLKSDGTDIAWSSDSTNDRDAAAVFNESGAAVDFRIEGDTEQNLFFVDGSANAIGMGTSSPSAVLDVVTDNNVWTGEFTQSNTSNGDGVIVTVGSTASADYALSIRSDAGNTHVLAAKADGNVGIGEASPDAPLHITSNTPIIVFDESDASQEWRLGSFGGVFALYDSTDSAYRLAVDGDGNVGIGTTSPDKKLEVAGTDVVAKFTGTDANPPQIEFENSTGVQATIGLKSGHDFIIDTAGEDVHIGPNASSAGANGLMVAATGNVGIGTTSPNSYTGYTSLTLNNATNGGLIDLESNGTRVSTFLGTSSQTNIGTITSTPLVFISDNTERMRIGSTGKVSWSAGGIGAVGTQSRDFTFYTEGASNGVDIRSNDYQIAFIGAAGSSGVGMDKGYMQLCVDGGAKIAFNSDGDSYFNGGKLAIGADHADEPLTVRSSGENVNTYLLELGNDLHASNTKDAWIKFVGGAATTDNSWTIGILSDTFRIVQLGARGTAPDSGTERLRINHLGRQGYNGSASYNAHGNFVGEVGASYKALSFERTVGGGEVGSIVTNASSTTYNTSSDYRLKENIDYDWDATTRLKQLKPARFNWIKDDTNTLLEGFLAHEVSSIVPEAIHGEKDAMTDPVLWGTHDTHPLPEGKSVGDVKTAPVPDYQSIDHSKLVPLLVKTIQELEARIKTLEDA